MLSMKGHDGVDNPGVKVATGCLQERSIGDIMGKRVLERVLYLRLALYLVEELRGLQVPQTFAKLVVSAISNESKEPIGNVLADHRRCLEKPLVGGRKPIDPRREYRFNSHRNLYRSDHPPYSVLAVIADERPGLRQRPHTLLDEEW